MHFRQQSAMEYLMTYGWAILIVAIVIVALFQLGIFNNSNIAPHAVAGSCQVVHNAAASSLAGQCNNELPQFVAQFNGASSYIKIPGTAALSPSLFTISAWIKVGTSNTWGTIMGYGGKCGWAPYALSLSSSGLAFQFNVANDITGCGYSSLNAPSSFTDGKWYSVIGAYTGSQLLLYVDGAQVSSSSYSNPGYNPIDNLYVGGNLNGYLYINGQMANLQVYNSTLDSSQVTSLYLEGIGGAPIDPTHIVGWWPLNGNAQDYSGNGNGGKPTNVAYNGTWATSYTQP